MPTFSALNHALQFGSNNPTVSIYGTDVAGFIVYQMSGSFYQFAPNTKYLALKVIFGTPYGSAPAAVTLTPGNSFTEQSLTAQPSVGFFIDGGNLPGDPTSDIQTSYFNISGISSATALLGPQTLTWYYEVNTGTAVSGGGGGVQLNVANTWTAKQTFSAHIAIDGYTIDLSSGPTVNQILQYNGTSVVPATYPIQESINVNDLYLTATGNTTVASVPTPAARGNYLVGVYYYIQPGANINFSVTLNWADLQNNQTVTPQSIALVPSGSKVAGSYSVVPVYIYVTSQGNNPITIVANTNTANRVYISASIIRL